MGLVSSPNERTELVNLNLTGVAGVDRGANHTQVGTGWLVLKADGTVVVPTAASSPTEGGTVTTATTAEPGTTAPAAAADPAPTPSEAPDALAKAMADPVVKAAFDKLAADAAKAQKAADDAAALAKAERDARLNREWIDKAEAFVPVAGEAAEFGLVLRAASEALTPEYFELLTTALTKGAVAIAATTVPAGTGVRKMEARSGDAAILDAAKALATEKGTTVAKAMDLLVDIRPDLFKDR